MSDLYYILVGEGYWIDEWHERHEKHKDESWTPRCIANVEGEEVAEQLCRALRLAFAAERYAEPAFVPVAAAKVPKAESAWWDLRIRKLERDPGFSGADDERSRDAAYHRMAGELEPEVRKQLGLAAPAKPEVTAVGDSDKPDANGHVAQPADASAYAAAKKKLAPSREKALGTYEWALSDIPGADKMTIPQLYDAITSHPKMKGEWLDQLPPNAEAFGKYLRDAGIKRYNTKGERISRITHFKRSDQV